MQMNITTDEKSKRVIVGDFGGDFISNLIIKRREPKENLPAEEKKSPTNSKFSFLNVESKSLGSRWNLKGIPNIRGIPNERRYVNNISRAIWTREESFDQDFMMPSRVREVLESEGLQDTVINKAISHDEKKYRKLNLKMAEETRLKEKRFTERPLESIVSRTKDQKPPYFTAMGSSSGPICNRREKLENWRESRDKSYSSDQEQDLETNQLNIGTDFQDSINNVQMDIDRAQWKSEQHAEKMFSGRNFIPPRIVLISSKVTKCHLLSKVLLDETVLHITYDFETWTFSDIIDAISQRLDRHRRHCKAKSIMVLCQGGPGYIYLLRNYVITPQKLTKPSYRGVVEFWKNLGNQISKLDSSEAAIHIFGFQLSGTEQGTKLIPMLQSLMYPNLVKVVAANDDTDEGKAIAGLYFKISRYKVWKMHQNTSVTDIDFTAEEAQEQSADKTAARRTKSDPVL